MKAWSATAALAAGIAVATAAPAGADDSSYLGPLQDQLSFLSKQQLLTEGHKVCDVISKGGVSSAQLVPVVQHDLQVSVAAAAMIVAAAVDNFGC